MATQGKPRSTRWARPAAFMGALLFGATAVASPDATTRIRGGEPVAAGEFPFIVELQIFRKETQQWLTNCTASLADPRAILTAAHCIPGVIPGSDPDVPVRLVFNRVNDEDAVRDVVTQDQIEQIIWNPEFGVIPHRDLAVVVLKTPYTRTPPVMLPGASMRPPLGAIITAAGWGTTDNPTDPLLLRKVDVPVVPCGPSDGALCAGIPGMGLGRGDSGGPGFQRHPEGTFTQYGVASGVSLDPGMISAYTDLSSPDVWQAVNKDLVAVGLQHLIPR